LIKKTYEKEIIFFKWKISDNLKIERFDYVNVPDDEQECHLNIMKEGFNEEKTSQINIDCSYQKYITKLRRSELFTLENVLVSTKRKDDELGGFVLQVRGTIPLQGITIRKKIVKKKKLTNEQKKIIGNRLKKSRIR